MSEKKEGVVQKEGAGLRKCLSTTLPSIERTTAPEEERSRICQKGGRVRWAGGREKGELVTLHGKRVLSDC